MSRMEFHAGTATEVAAGVKGLRAKAEELLKQDINILGNWDEKDDKWLEITNESYIYLRGRDELYVLNNHEECEDGINRVSTRDDGFFKHHDFVLSFYNGGGCLEEVLESQLNRLEKNAE